jgi:hypothetical protein
MEKRKLDIDGAADHETAIRLLSPFINIRKMHDLQQKTFAALNSYLSKK